MSGDVDERKEPDSDPPAPSARAREEHASAQGVTESALKSTLLNEGVFLRAFLDHTPAVMYAKDLDGRLILTNAAFDAFFRIEKGAMLGMTDHDYFPHELADTVRAFDRQVLAAGHLMQTEDVIPHPEGQRTYLTLKFPILDENNIARALGGVSLEITFMKKAEAEREAIQKKLIQAQNATIRELVTPLLPIADGIVTMPIIGVIDGARARSIVEVLLRGVVEHRARIAILDITGLKALDDHVADALLRSAQAVSLLGAEAVLTGVKPEIALALTDHDIDLRGLLTFGTLESGIAYALGKVSRGPSGQVRLIRRRAPRGRAAT